MVIDTKDYTDELETELLDNTTYRHTDTDNTKKIENKVRGLAEKMCKEGIITPELKQYLIPKECGLGKVQGNPKLHKRNNPYGTIINRRNHPTEKMAEVVEKELQEHVKSLPSFIQDTTDFFLQKIEGVQQPLHTDLVIFCINVKALYPSIPREEAREACFSEHFCGICSVQLSKRMEKDWDGVH
ncbi:hypothetical protein ScPMuIL_011149 [Solemya velum]